MKILNNKGNSLLEVLVSMTLFSFGMTQLATMGMIASKGNTSSDRITQATNFAQKTMEHAKTLDYNELDSIAGTVDYGEHSDYESLKCVTTITEDTTRNIKNINVTVYWNADKHSFACETIKSEIGL